MALEYTLMIEDHFELIEVIDILSSLQNIELRSGYLTAPGITINIEPTDQEEKMFVQDHFCFLPNLSLFFVQDKFTEVRLAHSSLIKIAVALLSHCYSDALLDFNGDTILLRRIKGQWLLYQDDPDFWQPVLLNLVPPHYEWVRAAQREFLIS